MNTLEVTYADKAGRLIEGSPDKTKLDTLPVSLNVDDVKALTTAQCNALRCGDIVTKEDSTGKHAYVVTFKKDNTGMCLTYADGSGYIETVSYDLTDGEWVYNSTDVFSAEDYAKKTEVPAGFDYYYERTSGTSDLTKDDVVALYELSHKSKCFYKVNLNGNLNIVYMVSFSTYQRYYSGVIFSSDLKSGLEVANVKVFTAEGNQPGINFNTIGGTKLYTHSISGISGLGGPSILVVRSLDGTKITNSSAYYVFTSSSVIQLTDVDGVHFIGVTKNMSPVLTSGDSITFHKLNNDGTVSNVSCTIGDLSDSVS